MLEQGVLLSFLFLGYPQRLLGVRRAKVGVLRPLAMEREPKTLCEGLARGWEEGTCGREARKEGFEGV